MIMNFLKEIFFVTFRIFFFLKNTTNVMINDISAFDHSQTVKMW